jgi:hypothetical protein
MYSILAKALDDELTEKYAALLDFEDATPHTFSHKFEKNCGRLVKARRKLYYTLIATAQRRVACVIATIFVLSIVTVMSVGALRTPLFSFIAETFKKYSIVKTDNAENSPVIIEDVYGITYPLDGFEITFEDKNADALYLCYGKDDEDIIFQQHTKLSYNQVINTEGTEILYIQMNDYEVMYYYNMNYHSYIWESKEYVFVVGSNLDKETSDEIVLSVKKLDS